MNNWPQIKNIDKCIKDISKVLASNHWTIRSQKLGHQYYTEEFEEKWAKYCNKKYSLLVSSGSSALEVCLRVINIKVGDEVIVPSLGWYATATAVTKLGAKPVFCDVDIETSCIAAKNAELLITSKTKAIIAVHLHCSFAPLEELNKICMKHNIVLLEDSAQAHGGTYNTHSPGHYSLAACYSFNQEKLIPSGEGGAIVTNNKDFFDKAYAIRTDGYNFYEDKGWLPSGILGSNFAISEFQSAILLNTLEEFDYFNSIRLKNAKLIYDILEPFEDISLILQSSNMTNYFFYEIGIIFSEKILAKISIDEIIFMINSYNIIEVGRTDIPTPNNPLFEPYYKQSKCNLEFKNANKIYNSLIVMHHKHLLVEGIQKIIFEYIKKVISLA